MMPAVAHSAAQAVEDLVQVLVDRGVIPPEAVPPTLARAIGRRRVIMQRLGLVGPRRPCNNTSGGTADG